jgi:hypothetical protein
MTAPAEATETFEDVRRRARHLITVIQAELQAANPGTVDQARCVRNALSCLAAAQADLRKAEAFDDPSTILI